MNLPSRCTGSQDRKRDDCHRFFLFAGCQSVRFLRLIVGGQGDSHDRPRRRARQVAGGRWQSPPPGEAPGTRLGKCSALRHGRLPERRWLTCSSHVACLPGTDDAPRPPQHGSPVQASKTKTPQSASASVGWESENRNYHGTGCSSTIPAPASEKRLPQPMTYYCTSPLTPLPGIHTTIMFSQGVDGQ